MSQNAGCPNMWFSTWACSPTPFALLRCWPLACRSSAVVLLSSRTTAGGESQETLRSCQGYTFLQHMPCFIGLSRVCSTSTFASHAAHSSSFGMDCDGEVTLILTEFVCCVTLSYAVQYAYQQACCSVLLAFWLACLFACLLCIILFCCVVLCFVLFLVV